MATCVGMNLGCSIDKVNHNINLIKLVEQARIDLVIQASVQQHEAPSKEVDVVCCYRNC